MELYYLHPAVIHFPLVFLITGVAADAIGSFFNRSFFLTVGRWCLGLGLLSTLAAVITGLIAHNTVPHGSDTYAFIERHQQMGFTILFLCSVLCILRFFVAPRFSFKALGKGIYTMIALLMIGALSYGAFLGGELVYIYGIGVKAAQEAVLDSDVVDDYFESL